MSGTAVVRSAPVLLLALPLLGVARLLPADGFGLWLRLVAATLVLLLPGSLIARALRLRAASATVVLALGALAPALALVFVVHSSIWLALVVLAVFAVAALPFALRIRSGPPARDTLAVAVAGLVLGGLLWHVAGVVNGDALFHLGRVRKLVELGDLHLHTVNEFRDGGLHPGYAFPLWHAFLALVAKLAGVDPTKVMLHQPSAVVPIAFAVVYESGVALFRSTWLGLGVLVATVTTAVFAPGDGGSYTLLAQPGTVARYVLVPATLTLFFLFLRHPGWQLGVALAAAGLEVFLVHASTAVFLGIVLVGFAVVRVVLTRRDLRSTAVALACLYVPVALALVWLLPIIRKTRSQSPSASELRRALTRYADELHVVSLHRYALRPEVVSRAGAVAVAALLLVPLASLAARQRWAAFVIGGTLAILTIELFVWSFPHFADAVSVSQARRLVGFLPLAFALVGAAGVLARVIGPFVLPVALAAGIGLQIAYPGDFGSQLTTGGPSWAAWVALFGALAAVAAGLVLGRRIDSGGVLAALAIVLFCLPVAVHGFRDWNASERADRYALTPGLLNTLREKVPKRSVVFSDMETSYRISAYAPVYVAAAPPAHVADTPANDPFGRRLAVIHYFLTANPKFLDRYDADWLVVDRSRFDIRPHWPLVYEDSRFALYHRPSA
jgi:hypothetical protein